MPNNRKSTLKKIKGREGAHPGSRKAAQINRSHLRNAKLKSQLKERKDMGKGKMFRPTWFIHSVTGPEALTLEELRTLVSEHYITRMDERIAELTAERRPGRPKTKELLELEEAKRMEAAEWDSGFEVPDLTDPRATKLMNTWIEDCMKITASHLDVLPFIRISKGAPETVVRSKPGQLDGMGLGDKLGEGMEVEDGAQVETDMATD